MALVINETNSVFGSGLSLVRSTVGGNVTVTKEGAVAAGSGVTAFYLTGFGAWTFQIDGLITGSNGIYLVPLHQPLSTITIGKSGEIFGTQTAIFVDSRTDIVNYGRLQGDGGIVEYSANTFKITNYGEILADVINETAAIRLDFSDPFETIGTHTIDNKGLISAYDGTDIGIAIYANGLSPTIITNTGTIDGHLSLGGGVDTVTNSGIITGYIDTWNGNDKLTNNGTIEGDVFLGSGNDTFTNTGTVEGAILMGSGSDTFIGGASEDVVVDEGGADNYNLGGGDDYFDAVETGSFNGVDTVVGGTNSTDLPVVQATDRDRYSAYDAVQSVFVNLSSAVSHGIAANTAKGAEIGTDKITGFESAFGGSANDVLVGSAIANVLWGRGGNDTLEGRAGNDVIFGDEGNDRIIGGAGRDFLYGDANADTFVYKALTDSTLDRTTRDVVKDFEDGIDHFDFNQLALINETFIGQNVAFSPTAGQSEIRVISKLFGWSVQVDKNGDGKADMVIDVNDATQSIVWDSSDFL